MSDKEISKFSLQYSRYFKIKLAQKCRVRLMSDKENSRINATDKVTRK